MLIEDIVRKATNLLLDDDVKISGLKKLGKIYGDNLYEMPPDEIEKELIAIYVEALKKGNKYFDQSRIFKKPEETEEEKEFIDELDERAKAVPELQYFNQMMRKNPEFKKIVKKLRSAKNQDEDDDEDLDSNPADSMYI